MSVHFIGAGPGAADLLTLRAVKLLNSAAVCLYAGTYLDDAVLTHVPADAERIDTQHLDLDTIVRVMTEAHRRGLSVARLCSGDPSIYSALAEQTRRLDEADVPWDVCPGVPAYAATAAALGCELTAPEVTQSLVLTRAQRDSTVMPAGESLANFARTGATLALHLAIRQTEQICAELADHYGADCPVAVGYRVSSPQELILRGTLTTMPSLVAEARLRQAAVILVGPALAREGFVESHLYSACRTRTPGG